MASPILPGTGLGSGLDTGAIVKALVAADKAAKQGQIDRATTTNSASISGIGTLQSLLSTFQSTLSVAGLGSSVNPAFAGFAATSSDSKTVDATADKLCGCRQILGYRQKSCNFVKSGQCGF